MIDIQVSIALSQLQFLPSFTSEQNPQVVMSSSSNQKPAPSIEVQGLSYKFQDGSSGLNNVDLSLPAGSRTLLIGGKNPFYTFRSSKG